MHVAVRLCYRRPHTGSGSLARSVSQSVCLLVGTRLLGLVSEVPRRTYAGPPIAHPAYDAAASRKTAAGGLAVGTQTRRRSIVPSCAQTRSSARAPHAWVPSSLSLSSLRVLWVYLRLMKRYHSDITPTASHLRRPTPCGRHTRVRCHCDLCDFTPRGKLRGSVPGAYGTDTVSTRK